MNNSAFLPSGWRPGLLAILAIVTTAAVVATVVWLVGIDFQRQSRLVNISVRGHVAGPAEPMLAGFVISEHSQTVVVRAIGPSLARQGVAKALAKPRLRIVRNRDGVDVARNEGWRTEENRRLLSDLSPYAPADPREVACVVTLPAGGYSALVETRDGKPGVALLEMFVIID